MKPIIGIIAPRRKNDIDPFENQTRFVDNFSKRVLEAGGIPIGLLFPDEKFILDELKLCDGLIIQGGPHLGSSHINVMHYAYTNKIPLLGVCLGMQTMAGYEWYRQTYPNKITYKDIEKTFKYSFEENYLYDKEGHNELDPFIIKEIEKCKHEVIITKDSRLYKIYKQEKLNMPSLHKSMSKELYNGGIFKVVGRYNGVIEAIESNDKNWWAIGVQFHPELEKENLKLFKTLIKESKK